MREIIVAVLKIMNSHRAVYFVLKKVKEVNYSKNKVIRYISRANKIA